MRYLYEFNFHNVVERIVEGESLQTETYLWRGVNKIEQDIYYINVVDESGSFHDFIANNVIDRVSVNRYTYDEGTGETTEASGNLYSEVSSDAKNTSLRVCDIPEEHLEDAQKLIGDGIVQFYEIKLADGSYLHLKANNSVNWNGFDWTGLPLLFEGYSSATADSYSRPTLSLANPDGAYSTFIRSGLLNRAVVNRYLVLYDDVINNRPVYQKKTWIIWFIQTVNKQLIQVELRNPMDGVNFNVPARRYMHPEFPFTELK